MTADSSTDASIVAKLKQYILSEFLPDEDPAKLTPQTELVSTGILDSVATLKLVTFLEDEWQIEVPPDQTDEEHLNTLQQIASLVRSRL